MSLLAVSKTWPVESLREAVDAGQYAFGENYVQEAVIKIAALRDVHHTSHTPKVEWHFIGPVQSNKTRIIAEQFDWLHSLHQEKHAERLAQQRPAGLAPLQVCLQVNVSGEASKSGCAPQDVAMLAQRVARMPGLRLRGLMAIPEPSDDGAVLRARFATLRHLQEELIREGYSLDTLSMGMSHDFEQAIAEGATIVRIGTAIFGERG